MARTFPAALALVVAVTGTSLPAAAAPPHPVTATLAAPVGLEFFAPTLTPTETSQAQALAQATPSLASRRVAAKGDGAATSWSRPLTGVSRGQR